MRSLSDPDFAAVCDSVGAGKISKPVIEYFEEKVGKTDDCFFDNDNFKKGEVAIIVADNAKVDQINHSKLSQLLPDEEQIVFKAEDKIKNVNKITPRLEEVAYTKTGGLRTILSLKKNCPILVTMNLDKADFLTNGQRGFVVDIDECNSIIWVEFPDKKIGARRRRMSKFKLKDHPDAVPIKKEKTSFSWGSKGSVIRIQRTQFPVVLSYAMTSHKCQGMTISKVLVDYTDLEGKPVNVPAGSFYVAITRVRNGSDLFLTCFSPAFIKCSKSVEDEMSRMEKRVEYQFYKRFLHDTVFVATSSETFVETKVSYLNINGVNNLTYGVNNLIWSK